MASAQSGSGAAEMKASGSSGESVMQGTTCVDLLNNEDLKFIFVGGKGGGPLTLLITQSVS